jgi:hypothetical protein
MVTDVVVARHEHHGLAQLGKPSAAMREVLLVSDTVESNVPGVNDEVNHVVPKLSGN